jgi:hypothetical protein
MPDVVKYVIESGGRSSSRPTHQDTSEAPSSMTEGVPRAMEPHWTTQDSIREGRGEVGDTCHDKLHQPLSSQELLCFVNATFVNDNGITAYQSDIRTALHQSIQSPFLLFGRPEDDRHQSCNNDDKWDPVVSHIMLYLGFLIDLRAMTVSWPLAKRLELHDQIMCILNNPFGMKHHLGKSHPALARFGL